MATTPCIDLSNNSIFCKNRPISVVGSSAFPLRQSSKRPAQCFLKERNYPRKFIRQGAIPFLKRTSFSSISKTSLSTITRCSNPSNLGGDRDEPSNQEKTPFGYTRKDVLLIGLGVTLAGIGLESGLEYLGVDPLQAGNVVQLVLVLGLTIGWISTYIFRVSNKEMTYAQQLRDYEVKVMEKRLESLTEAEIQALLEQVEEEKRRLAGGEQMK